MGEEAPVLSVWSKESAAAAGVVKQAALGTLWSEPVPVAAVFSESGSLVANWGAEHSPVYSPDHLPVFTSDGESVYVRG